MGTLNRAPTRPAHSPLDIASCGYRNGEGSTVALGQEYQAQHRGVNHRVRGWSCGQIRRAELDPATPYYARLRTYRMVIPRKAFPPSGESFPGNGQVFDPAKAIRPGHKRQPKKRVKTVQLRELGREG